MSKQNNTSNANKLATGIALVILGVFFLPLIMTLGVIFIITGSIVTLIAINIIYKDKKATLQQNKNKAQEQTTINDPVEISKENKEQINEPAKEQLDEICEVKPGEIRTWPITVDPFAYEQLEKSFIAFDVETTGLSSYSDRIIEVGAVLYENKKPIKKFSSLVNPRKEISEKIIELTGITNEMLSDAPKEKDVYEDLAVFLEPALHNDTIITAHNASFDMCFLEEALKRFGISGNIYYVDTLSLSRKYLYLGNNKQETVANYFGITNEHAHRAVNDAETCGEILCNLLDVMKHDIDKEKESIIRKTPNEEELTTCAIIQKILYDAGYSTRLLSFQKLSGNYVTVNYSLSNAFRFKHAKKGNYIIVNKDIENIDMTNTEPCTKSESYYGDFRLFFKSPLDLYDISDYILKTFKPIYKQAREINNRIGLERSYENAVANSYYTMDIDKMMDIISKV